MALYVSAERLRAAVDRLRQSRASGGMVNFLILKRAVAIANGESVALSTKDKRLQQAITELTWWPADSMSNDERPFIDVFGSIKDKTHGMKKHKYRSTGPSDTLRNGAWSPVVAIGEGPDRRWRTCK